MILLSNVVHGSMQCRPSGYVATFGRTLMLSLHQQKKRNNGGIAKSVNTRPGRKS
jgi:hypothetical protein